MKQRLSTHGIGASEIAAICGFSPYASPWNVWLKKTGQAPDIEDGAPIEWGHRLEPAIRQAYADKTGAVMHVPSESMFHAETQWARATPDAIVLESAEPLAKWTHLMQAKNVGFWPGKDWDEGPPVYVQLQEAWELYVTGLQRADVAALIGGWDFRVYTVHRDDRTIADLVDIADAFWRRVETRTAPPIDDSEACRDHFIRRLRKAPVVEIVADDSLESTMAEWRMARRSLKAAEKTVETMRNRVLAAMTDAQADRVISRHGIPKLARHSAREHKDTNWKYVAEMLCAATGAHETFATLATAATTTTTTEPTVSLREPSEWSKEKV